MAKLIVTLPRVGRSGDSARWFRIIVDGLRFKPTGDGSLVELELAPGPHQVQVRLGFMRSRPMAIDARADETHYLAATFSARFRSVERMLTILMVVAQFAVLASISGAFQQPGGSSDLLMPTMMAVSVSAVVFSMTMSLIARNHGLSLTEIPALDLTAEPIAELTTPQAMRVRFTLRQAMLAVAVLALIFWIGIEGTRRQKAHLFRFRARIHADQEAMFRKFEQDSIKLELQMEKTGYGKGSFVGMAAWEAEVADYHAAMRRKYEEAIARGTFSVEPDPPAPPWP